MANKPDLSKLPLHIRKLSTYWYYDSKAGKRIHVNNIEKHLPKETIVTEPQQYWWQKL